MFVARRPIAAPDAAAGFSLMELAVTIAIAAVLMTALLNRVMFYREEAERLAVEHVVAALRSALQLQMVSLMTGGRTSELPTLAVQNPMDWLAQKPTNYLGAFYDPHLSDVVPGNWYFDKKDKKLVYLFNHNDYFEVPEQNQLNFKVKLVNNRRNNRENSSKQNEEYSVPIFEGVVLDQITP